MISNNSGSHNTLIDKSPLSGFLLAVFSFVFWGIVPVYFKAVSAVPPLEVLSHRIVWSTLLLSALVLITRKQHEIRSALKDIKTLGWLTLSAILIAANWLTFIWGVSHNHILQTSLGYFITPLVNVLFGFLFFGERLSRFGMAAIVLASVGVFLQVYLVGSLPMVAMLVAVTFGLYGLVRKKIDVKPIPGLTIETFILLPPALIWLGWLVYQGNAHLSVENPDLSLLLITAGLVTTIPLVTFNMAAKRLSLTVLGMVQYIGPTLSFLIGVYVYSEPMDAHRLTTFALIWLGLAVFSFGSMMSYRKQIAAS